MPKYLVDQIKKVLDDEILGKLTVHEALGKIQKIVEWEPPCETILLGSNLPTKKETK